jgi:hypothetical protein
MTAAAVAEAAWGDTPDVLNAVACEARALAIWRRPEPPRLSCWLDGLPRRCLPGGRVMTQPRHARAALEALFAACGTPAGFERDEFADDIVRLTARFACLAAADEVDIRLDRITGNACRRFHRDFVRLRLLTTYAGTGTQWVPAPAAAQALTEQSRYQGPLETLPRYAVALFKGSLEQPDCGVVHRSPPIAGTGMVRLLLCLNLPSDASPPSWRP